MVLGAWAAAYLCAGHSAADFGVFLHATYELIFWFFIDARLALPSSFNFNLGSLGEALIAVFAVLGQRLTGPVDLLVASKGCALITFVLGLVKSAVAVSSSVISTLESAISTLENVGECFDQPVPFYRIAGVESFQDAAEVVDESTSKACKTDLAAGSKA